MSNILERRNVTGNPDIDFMLQGETHEQKMALKFEVIRLLLCMAFLYLLNRIAQRFAENGRIFDPQNLVNRVLDTIWQSSALNKFQNLWQTLTLELINS